MTPELRDNLDRSAQVAVLMRLHLEEAILDIWELTGACPTVGALMLLATEVMVEASQDAHDAREEIHL